MEEASEREGGRARGQVGRRMEVRVRSVGWLLRGDEEEEDKERKEDEGMDEEEGSEQQNSERRSTRRRRTFRDGNVR